jgi:mannosyl-oligosaccharide alpha-1,2-mannosidase
MWFDATDPSAFPNITKIEDGVTTTLRTIRGIPPGTKWLDRRYLGRPETIESVFYMCVSLALLLAVFAEFYVTIRYRITGDKKWQDKGWRMFVSWTKAALAPGGYSSLTDVRMKQPTQGDNMESFVFAETFKYVGSPWQS